MALATEEQLRDRWKRRQGTIRKILENVRENPLEDWTLLLANLPHVDEIDPTPLLGVNGERVGTTRYGRDLRGIDLSSLGNLYGLRLNYADLSYACLHEALLDDTDFGYAKFYRTNMRNVHMCGVILTGANLHEARLCNADLSEAKLTGAMLLDADLSNARLNSANLANATLNRADLTGAHFEGANLQKAEIARANLQGFFVDGKTQFFDGRTARLREEDKARSEELHGLRSIFLALKVNHDALNASNTEYSKLTHAYRHLSSALQRADLYTKAAEAHSRQMVCNRKMSYPLWTPSAYADWVPCLLCLTAMFGRFIEWVFLDLLCGYGEKISHVVTWIIAVILVFALLYSLNDDKLLRDMSWEIPHANTTSNCPVLSGHCTAATFGDALYFSIVVFSTLGLGDIHPDQTFGEAKIINLLICVESLSGILLMSLLGTVLIRRALRE